ncbi:hypothetical protein Tco_0040176 [Tanacetum coccineum]
MDEIVETENMDVTTIVTPSNVKTVESNHESADVKSNGDAVEPKTVRKNSFRPPVIKDWNSDDDSNPQQKEYKEKGVIDSGFSRHMTGNKCYLTEYEDYDDGFVSYRDGKGIISGKVSKAMRVFNKRTRIVKETLNIRFLENTPNVTGNGPDWLFDVDSLTISMNYVPVVAGNQTNGIGETEKTYPKVSEEDAEEKPTEMDVSGALDKDGKDDQATRSEFERLLQQEKQTVHPNSTNSINTVSTPVSTARPSFTNDDTSSPVNAAKASNTFEEHLFKRFSPFKNALLHFPPISNVTHG